MKSVSVTVAGVDYSRKATGGEEFILSHTLIIQPIMVGMSWRQEHDVIGCDASTARQQGEKDMSNFPLCMPCKTQAQGWPCSLGQFIPPHLN